MAGFGNMDQGWKQRLLYELRRDKRKTSLMLGLLAVAAVVGARTFWSVSVSPASVQGAVVSLAPGTTPGTASQGSAAHPAPGTSPREAARKFVPPRRAISQDLFAPQLEDYPLAQEEKPVATTAAATQAVDPEQTKADAIRSKARDLSLQSTFLSGAPKAIISGQLVGVGDLVQGFQVTEVTSRACVLTQEGVRVQIDMKDQ